MFFIVQWFQCAGLPEAQGHWGNGQLRRSQSAVGKTQGSEWPGSDDRLADWLDNLLKKLHWILDAPFQKVSSHLGYRRHFFFILLCVSQAKAKTVVVIGGGLSGLACGKYLSDAGHKAVRTSDGTFLILLHHCIYILVYLRKRWRFWTGVVKL